MILLRVVALIASATGILRQTGSKDDALAALSSALQEVALAARDLTTTAKNAPEDVGPALKKLAAGILDK